MDHTTILLASTKRQLPVKTMRVTIAAALFVCSGWLAMSASAFENVNMATTLSVEGGQLVVRWSTGGFDHYNIRWSEDGGPVRQVEREGDKRFRYLTRFRPGVAYLVAVQGCEKSFAGKSQCTSWDEAFCGPAGSPCDGTQRPAADNLDQTSSSGDGCVRVRLRLAGSPAAGSRLRNPRVSRSRGPGEPKRFKTLESRRRLRPQDMRPGLRLARGLQWRHSLRNAPASRRG